MVSPLPQADADIIDQQAAALGFLRRPGTFAVRETAREIDTHAAFIFLVGDFAWKLKRAVRFGYLDFSTVGKRQAALRDELRLNRRTAPDLYLQVIPLTRDKAGQLAIGGDGAPIDWLLQMRRFPDDALFSEMADRGAIDFGVLTRLADHIAAFHADAEIVPDEDTHARFRAVVDGNAESLALYPQILEPIDAVLLCESHRNAVSALGALLDNRGRGGRVRHGHGDLHLANIALIEGEAQMFDCLEFSPTLATIDVLYDVAFLIMDLWHRGMPVAANIVFNRYLDISEADEGGVALMPLFVSVRAAIRAHVLAAQAVRAGSLPGLADQARRYLDLAIAAMMPQPASLVAIGGLSGTGKSSLARALASDIGRIPGARVLRSDVLRKRLAGVLPERRLDADAYTPAAAARTYCVLDSIASATLASGHAVIADAVFARVEERDSIAAVAHRMVCPFHGIWLVAPDKMRLERVDLRTADASDANSDVALAQSNIEIGDLGRWHILSADNAPDLAAAEARALLRPA